MAFLICKKCKSGVHSSITEAEKIFGMKLGEPHRNCGGEVYEVTDQQAGAGPGYTPPPFDPSKVN